MTKPYSPPSFRAPGPLTGQLGNVPAPRSRGSWALAATGLVVAVASAVTGGFALGRHTPTTSPGIGHVVDRYLVGGAGPGPGRCSGGEIGSMHRVGGGFERNGCRPATISR